MVNQESKVRTMKGALRAFFLARISPKNCYQTFKVAKKGIIFRM